MRANVRTIVWAVAAIMVLSGCAAKIHYAHDLPVAYRSVTNKSDLAQTVQACRTVLEARGYEVVCADSVAGLVFTKPRVIPPKSKEIGGTARVQWMLIVRPMEAGSLMTAELIPEAPDVGAWWPQRMSQWDAMAAYRELFSEIQDQLDSLSSALDQEGAGAESAN